MKRLVDVLAILPTYQVNQAISDISMNGLTIDSRQVKSGDLFICIEGYTVDGHDFVKQAEANGACAIVAQKALNETNIPVIYVRDTVRILALLANSYYDMPTNDLQLIGVTGTNGKTSVTNLLDDIFKLDKRVTGSIGTIQMKIADTIHEVSNTTPEASFLQKSFRNMVDQGVKTAIMEVSSHALEIGRVNGCDFNIAIFTNLSQDHLDYHGDMPSYFQAKSRLFRQLGNRYDPDNPKYAVINLDDAYSENFIHATTQPVVTYGIEQKADVSASQIKLEANGTTFILETFYGNITIKSKLIGKFSIYNMLAAATASLLAGVPLETVKEALENTTGVRGRFEPVLAGQPFGVIVDYAHTPDSLENVLQTMQGFVKGKIYVVVGCGGDRDRTKRPLMAQIASKYADYAFYTSDNPRSEDPDSIIADMVTGLEATNYEVIIDREKAIKKSITSASENDMILIAGKGHETYQIIGTEIVDFDDRAVATEAIKQYL
ncbi:UDP-N-acetylmuramoyl-L-alanyl-D-glutamate--2,6-diaminopimelate ligase [Paraliobacillus quinghaiensis]|uniref:UDP-N-acetylmuramoyl-L-alanyl-D-glutamate--2,6-diaminopimelate ligase n=1 Tax=Paraliobacillus quinghaiensis TaxID=470815 RepID=A0A917WQ24_9BACI|nr:UDP-N-acetylmuramoyl-L-alanyl-D-glutamate--2,6-diaminopimelate ligase [Paraliobacillus quinghaiensis]